jgi:acetyl-CoA acetyltransferase family protein
LKDLRIDDLGALVVKAALARVPQIELGMVEDVIMGCAVPEGEQGLNVARLIGILAGLPETVGGVTVNRFCSSGLQTINMAAQNVMLGMGDVFIAGGIESMSHVPMSGFNPSMNRRLVGGKSGLPEAYISMGMTAENVVRTYNLSRTEQDEFALHSHQKAVKAQAEGMFKAEIEPVALPGGGVMENDECPRADTTMERLASLKPVFVDGGSVTAGNSSPLNDGAAAVVVMSLGKARELGIKPIARVVTLAVAGVAPELMGIGPIPAVKKALARAGMSIADIDIVELNEAFASQALVVARELGIPSEKLNPKGGAIAIGHPLGCTGSRIMATLINDLQQFDKTFGLETMCIGGGQGLATIIERMN